MILYLTIFAVLVLIGVAARSREQVIIWSVLVGLFLLFFMGTRYETGCDYLRYLDRFNFLYYNKSYNSYLFSEEQAFHFLNLLIKDLKLDYLWLNIAASLIYLLCLLRFSRLSPWPLLLVSLFFPILIVQLGMSGLRQALAVGFLMLAFSSYVEKNKIHIALWVLVAAQFHSSAYIFLPLALLAGKQISTVRLMVALLIAGPLVAYLLGERAQVYNARYIEQIYGENSSTGGLFRYFLILIPAVLFELHKDKVKWFFHNTYDLMRLFSLITFALAPIGLLSTVALHRVTFYVMPVSILMLINVSMVLHKRTGISKQMLIVPVVIFSVYMLGWFGLSGHAASCYVPYESTIFSK